MDDFVNASRRVGWAKYYEAEALTEHLKGLLAHIAIAIATHPGLPAADPLMGWAERARIASSD